MIHYKNLENTHTNTHFVECSCISYYWFISFFFQFQFLHKIKQLKINQLNILIATNEQKGKKRKKKTPEETYCDILHILIFHIT